MKKILMVLLVLFIANVGCKKTGIDGGGLCACSPIEGTYLSLVIKNANGVDLLNPATAGYFDKAQIQLYTKDANNAIKQLNFQMRYPFPSTSKTSLNFYQVSSYEIIGLAKSIDNTFYLKLGNDKLYEINIKLTADNRFIEKLLINKAEATRELPTETDPYLRSIFTIKI